ncbi:hypothetical protein VNI00_018658 [Paramarasmius palmivorus]|uniref:Uncharacterized protein n=1 Tax=Paramarasmius palmivorus TaxID=297713 RepID=A0AAW0AXW1_9AGAR
MGFATPFPPNPTIYSPSLFPPNIYTPTSSQSLSMINCTTDSPLFDPSYAFQGAAQQSSFDLGSDYTRYEYPANVMPINLGNSFEMSPHANTSMVGQVTFDITQLIPSDAYAFPENSGFQQCTNTTALSSEPQSTPFYESGSGFNGDSLEEEDSYDSDSDDDEDDAKKLEAIGVAPIEGPWLIPRINHKPSMPYNTRDELRAEYSWIANMYQKPESVRTRMLYVREALDLIREMRMNTATGDFGEYPELQAALSIVFEGDLEMFLALLERKRMIFHLSDEVYHLENFTSMSASQVSMIIQAFDTSNIDE